MNITDVLFEKVDLKVDAITALNSKEKYHMERTCRNPAMQLTYHNKNVEEKELREDCYSGSVKDETIELMYDILITAAYFNARDQKGWTWKLCSSSVKKSLVIAEARKVYHQQKHTLRNNCFIAIMTADYNMSPFKD